MRVAALAEAVCIAFRGGRAIVGGIALLSANPLAVHLVQLRVQAALAVLSAIVLVANAL